MTKEQMAVTEWMLRAWQECPVKPKLVGNEVSVLRVNLIKEELGELIEAHNTGNLVEVADALADLLYVVLGTASAYGIDLEPVFWEVHRSNMTKFIDGYRRADGKWMKGKSSCPPNLEPIIEAQMHK